MKMRSERRVAYTRRREIYKAFGLGNLEDGTHLEDMCADGKMILKLIFKKYYRRFHRD
jgi:hypothetical protein